MLVYGFCGGCKKLKYENTNDLNINYLFCSSFLFRLFWFFISFFLLFILSIEILASLSEV